MATYYIPTRASISTSAASPEPAHERTGENENEDQLASLDLTSGSHSIYVFPNPSSAPPSPYLVSPADHAVTQRYHRRNLSRCTETNTAASTSHASPSPSRLADADADVNTDGDLDTWDCSLDSSDCISPLSPADTESWLLEGEVARAARWDVPTLTPADARSALQQRTQHALLHMSATAPGPPPARITLDHVRRLHPLRPPARTHSNSRASDFSLSLSSRSAPTPAPAPQPRAPLPLLAFFARLLALDLDDPALRLLTLPAPDADGGALLFPGSSPRLFAPPPCAATRASSRPQRDADADSADALSCSSSSSSDCEEDYRDDEYAPECGCEASAASPSLLRLLAADPHAAALRSLRAGLAVPFDFGLNINVGAGAGLAGLWRAVGEVCVRGGQAWREVWFGA